MEGKNGELILLSVFGFNAAIRNGEETVARVVVVVCVSGVCMLEKVYCVLLSLSP